MSDDKEEKWRGVAGSGKRARQKVATKLEDSEVRKEVVAKTQKEIGAAGAQRTRTRGVCRCQRDRQELIL